MIWMARNVLCRTLPCVRPSFSATAFPAVPDANIQRISDDKYSEMLDDQLEDKFADEFLRSLDGLGDSSPLPDADEALEDFVLQKVDRGVFKGD